MATITFTDKSQYFLKLGQFCVDLGKKLFNKNNYVKSGEYYSAILNQYLNFGNYINIFANTLHLNPIHTNVSIQPDILGASIKSAEAKNGKLDFVFRENNLTIYLYKWKFNGLKTRCEIHFYNEKAFLINYNYSILSNANKDYVVKTIARKYLNQDIGDIDISDMKIIDKNNNTLFINDMLDYKVTYFSKEADWLMGFTGEVNAKREKQNIKIKIAEEHFYSKV